METGSFPDFSRPNCLNRPVQADHDEGVAYGEQTEQL
jgi:hypothetical protein